MIHSSASPRALLFSKSFSFIARAAYTHLMVTSPVARADTPYRGKHSPPAQHRDADSNWKLRFSLCSRGMHPNRGITLLPRAIAETPSDVQCKKLRKELSI